eukprot:7377140-Prymnesium_polylepis.1
MAATRCKSLGPLEPDTVGMDMAHAILAACTPNLRVRLRAISKSWLRAVMTCRADCNLQIFMCGSALIPISRIFFENLEDEGLLLLAYFLKKPSYFAQG